MSLFDLFWHKDSNTVRVTQEGGEAPQDYEKVGQHEDKPGSVLINTIRDILYHHGHHNMASVKVLVDDDVQLDPRPADQADPALSTQQPTSNLAADDGSETTPTPTDSQQNADNSGASAQDSSNVEPVEASDANVSDQTNAVESTESDDVTGKKTSKTK